MNVLTPCHLAEHLQWCQMKVLGRRLFFSDKSHDLLSCADGHTRVYRHQGEHYAPNCMQQVDCFGRGSHGWAGIHHGLRMALVHAEGALTRSCSIRSSTVECFSMIMPNHMLDMLVWSFCSATSRHYRGLPVHRIKTQEHLWDALDQHVHQRNPPSLTLLQLVLALHYEW